MSSYKNLLIAGHEARPLTEILKASPAVIQGVSEADAKHLKDAFNIRTVEDLANCKVFRFARILLAAATTPAFDPGPPDSWIEVFTQAPLAHYSNHPKKRFRIHFGPVYYRGRLDGTARVLILGQDPSTNEILARRIFVGSSGQRVQKLLAKLGITRSYVMANTFLFSVFGQFDDDLRDISLEPEVLAYRNRCLDKARAESPIEAAIGFGAGAEHALQHWPGGQDLPLFFLTHPAAPDSVTLPNWNGQLRAMADAIAPDPDGAVDITPYGASFTEADSAPVPPFDLPLGIPEWHGRNGGHSGRSGNQKIIWCSPLA